MVSDEKKLRVIESIKKLVALGVAENEIVNNLTDVGINATEARKLIDEAKGKTIPNESGPPKPTEKNLFDSHTKNLSIDDQIAGQLNIKSSQSKDTQPKKEIPKTTPGEISNNMELGIQVKESSKKQNTEEEQNEVVDNLVPTEEEKKEVEEKKENTESEKATVEVPKKKFGLFGKKQNKDPIAELQKELNLTSEKKEPTVTKKQEETKPESKPVDVVQNVVDKKVEEEVAEKVAPTVSSDELEQLWKKGIVTAINSKLSEMQKLKDNIDAEINDQVNLGIKKELAQFKVLLDSQKALIVSTNKEALEDKQKEITFIIDSKIAELKKQSAELSKGIEKVQDAKQEQEAAMQKIQTTLDEAKKTKAQLMVEMNSELMKAKSDAQAFIDTSEKHLQELDDRVNKTLQLEKNVADGLVAEAEQKIEKLTIAKADDLIEKLEVKVNNIEAMEKKIDPERLEEKINILEEFKKQFLQNMQENLTQINEAIKEINIKNEEADKLLQEKTLAIDAKLEELTKFEKKFTENMENLLKK